MDHRIICFLSILIVAIAVTFTLWKLVYKEKELHCIAILYTVVSFAITALMFFYFFG